MCGVKLLNALESCNLVVCEQPVRHDDVRGITFVRHSVRTLIMADPVSVWLAGSHPTTTASATTHVALVRLPVRDLPPIAGR